MLELKTRKEFEDASAQRLKGFLVVHLFSAAWSDECKLVKTALEAIKDDKEYAKTKIFWIDAEKLEDVSEQYRIQEVPTLIFLMGKSTEEKLGGADPPKILQKIRELQKRVDFACLGDKTVEAKAEGTGDLNDRLQKLIKKAPIMLFMKGTPVDAQCGFSRKAVALLNKYVAKYDSFDILSDQAVREGLKKYSNWPSYPQLYINGELIGGVDIMNEMDESGELEKALKGANGNDPSEQRWLTLVNKAPIMVFMKGSPETPRCGFSRTLISILNSTGFKYETFDILEDEEVRQGLKAFSKWPTYPQVYVKGELIGGVDIIQQLDQSGELKSALGEA